MSHVLIHGALRFHITYSFSALVWTVNIYINYVFELILTNAINLTADLTNLITPPHI